MAIVTEHFNRSEFDCHDGTQYPAEWIEHRLKPLCNALEVIRSLTGQTMHITSGYRTEKYNIDTYKAMGSKPTKSKHTHGIAADIKLNGMNPSQLYKAIETLIHEKAIPDGGVGMYDTFVHYDIRCTFENNPPARWDERSYKGR